MTIQLVPTTLQLDHHLGILLAQFTATFGVKKFFTICGYEPSSLLQVLSSANTALTWPISNIRYSPFTKLNYLLSLQVYKTHNKMQHFIVTLLDNL